MKKKVPALAGILIAAVIFVAMLWRLPDQDNRFVSDASLQGEECPVTVPDQEGIVPGGHIHSKVTKVTDGDTIKVEYSGKTYRVRLMYIDTPETVKEGVAVQPYGKEASEKLVGLLANKDVTLVFEKDVYDDYDRLLAFVLTNDGACVNTYMVDRGYARVNAVKPNTSYKEYFEGLQEDAIRGKRGMWSFPADERPFIEKNDGYYVPRYYNDAA